MRLLDHPLSKSNGWSSGQQFDRNTSISIPFHPFSFSHQQNNFHNNSRTGTFSELLSSLSRFPFATTIVIIVRGTRSTSTKSKNSPRIYQETRETFYSQQFPEILLSPDTRYFSLSLSRNFARVSRDGNFFHNAVIFPYSLVTLFNITGTNTTCRYVPYLFLRSSSRIIHLAHFFITMHRIKASLRDFSQW